MTFDDITAIVVFPPLSGGLPSPGNFKIAGLTLLERHLKILRMLSVGRVYLIGELSFFPKGFSSSKDWVQPLNVAAAVKLRNEVKGTVLIIDGRLVYEPDLLKAAIENPCVMVHKRNGDTEPVGIWHVIPADIDEHQWKELILNPLSPSESGLPLKRAGEHFWMRIQTKKDAMAASVAIVRKAGRKHSDGLVSRHLNRAISTRITRLLVGRVSPDAITISSFLLGLFAAAVATFSPALGGLLFQINSVLDGVDGEMTRATLSTSPFGGWIDSIMDRYVDAAFLIALTPFVPLSVGTVIIVCLCLFGSVMVSYTSEKYTAAFQSNLYTDVNPLRYIPGKRDERIFIIMILCLAGEIYAIFLLLAVLTNLRVGITIYLVRRLKRGGQSPLKQV